ncbi:hypothetical protein BDZ97DRAFT_1803944 [Flammula alnicola]|nr:hypothetical protein BDZ97DRAFT_1803944 [Flammula alnicola]
MQTILGWDILRQNVAFGAFHNSAEQYDLPKCHPGTREAILMKITEWIEDPDNLRLFLWIHGPAGSGKTTIALTIAEMCYKAGILAAGFFFSRAAAGHYNDKLFISTIAFQVCILIPETREIVGKTVFKNPSILSQSLPIQLQELILGPLNHALQDENVMTRLRLRPKVIVIDGLDECGDGKSQRRILDTLAAAARQFNIPLRFLISSRPDFEIRQAFQFTLLSSLTEGLPLDDTYHPDRDIHTFLISKFDEIKQQHPLAIYLPLIWPSEGDIFTLVDKASGQFIYASTIVKYIESPRHRPEDRLGFVLGLTPATARDSPFADLDALYHQILSSAADPERLLEVLACIILPSTGDHLTMYPHETEDLRSPASIETILAYQPGDVDVILCDMHAILNVPRDRTRDIALYHASLADFLLDQSRSRDFFVDVEKSHANLARKSPDDRERALVTSFLLSHCLQSCLTSELSNDLRNLDLFSLVVHAVDFAYYQNFRLWVRFLDWLREKGSLDSTKILLETHLRSQDDWVRQQLTGYSPEYQSFLAAALTFDYFDLINRATLFYVLAYSITAERTNFREVTSYLHQNRFFLEIVEIKKQSLQPLAHNYTRVLGPTIRNFLLDPLHAGPLFVDGNKYAVLCSKLAGFLYKRQHDLLPEIISFLAFQISQYGGDRPWIPTEEDILGDAFEFLRSALPKATPIPRLAELMRDHALQYPKYKPAQPLKPKLHLRKKRKFPQQFRHQFAGRRQGAALAALEYIKRCETPYLEHSTADSNHEICLICSEYPYNWLNGAEFSILFGPKSQASVDDAVNGDELGDVPQADFNPGVIEDVLDSTPSRTVDESRVDARPQAMGKSQEQVLSKYGPKKPLWKRIFGVGSTQRKGKKG